MRSGVCAKLFQLYKYSMIIQATLNLCCMLCKLRTHKPKLQTRDFDNHIEATCASLLSYLIATIDSVNSDVRVQVLLRASILLIIYVYQGWKAHWYFIMGRAGKLTAKSWYML